jgi:hypothetical protein
MMRVLYASLLVVVVVLALQGTDALQQGFVTREMSGRHATREIGGKNHVAPQEVGREGSYTYASPAAGPAMMMFAKRKTTPVIADGGFIKIDKKFDTQHVGVGPTKKQKAPWSVTPEQHGAALGWSGKHISGGKEFPVGY